jgi:putative membrane protein
MFSVRKKETVMSVNPYDRFQKSDLILRDELAIDRTILANERTLMAYLRSGAALLIAGGSIIHFSNQGWFFAVGIVCLPGGLVTALVGVLRYRKMHKSISVVRKELASTQEK